MLCVMPLDKALYLYIVSAHLAEIGYRCCRASPPPPHTQNTKIIGNWLTYHGIHRTNLGKYQINYLNIQDNYTLICIALCSGFVNEKCLRFFFIILIVRLYVCAVLSRLNPCFKETLEEVKNCRNSVLRP